MRSEGRTTRSEMDAISLLKKDHTEVRALLKRLESSAKDGGDEAKDLLGQLETEIQAHTTIEEEIFYPAFRDALESETDEHLYFEAIEEHHMVDIAMSEIKDLDSYGPEFAAKAKVIKDLIEHHADEEERQMLPKAKGLMDNDQLKELGRRMQARKQEIIGETPEGEIAA